MKIKIIGYFYDSTGFGDIVDKKICNRGTHDKSKFIIKALNKTVEDVNKTSLRSNKWIKDRGSDSALILIPVVVKIKGIRTNTIFARTAKDSTVDLLIEDDVQVSLLKSLPSFKNCKIIKDKDSPPYVRLPNLFLKESVHFWDEGVIDTTGHKQLSKTDSTMFTNNKNDTCTHNSDSKEDEEFQSQQTLG